MNITKRLFLVFLLYFSSLSYAEGEVLCSYFHNTIVKYFNPIQAEEDAGESGNGSLTTTENPFTHKLLNGNTTERCPRTSQYCYTFWREDVATNKTTILAQGCWDSPNKLDCTPNVCRPRRSTRAHNNTNFCCCQGNFCNQNISLLLLPPLELASGPMHTAAHTHQVLEDSQGYSLELIIGILVFGLSILVIVGFFILRSSRAAKKSSADALNMEAPNTPPLSLEGLTIVQENIARGRYGTVSSATLGRGEMVAVKKFAHHNRQFFLNEKYIYTLSHMSHPCLLKYLGSQEHMTPEGKPEYWLVLSYAAHGSLQDYLTANTVDWPQLCRMAQSVTAGLAHLHNEIIVGGGMYAVTQKKCIAHRDLSSNNILVCSTDGSCKICDLGFSICIQGSKYFMNGEEQMAENNSLADVSCLAVGTLRYMAPEVLEGAVNLRECEASLKQIDVYALGLILWEIASRCSDLYQGMEVPPYKLPFEAEIGQHCTMEQLQVLVSKNKARPLFPDVWKDSNPAVRTLKETIEDCWDQDAEARLTARCVEERLADLLSVWERFKAGVSPTTLNTTTAAPLPYFLPNCGGGGASESTEHTTETLLSPSSETLAPAKNCLLAPPTTTGPRVTVPLQPYQGRNPCIERNLMMTENSDDVAVEGNTLLGRGQRPTNSDTMPLFAESESNALVPNEYLSQPARIIPYLQNAVHAPETVPKQPNVPGNGHQIPPPNSFYGGKHKKSYHLLSDCSRGKKFERSLRKGLRNLMGGGRKKKSNLAQECNASPIETEVFLSNKSGLVVKPCTTDINDNSFGQQRPKDLPLEQPTCSEEGGESSSSSKEKIAMRVKTPYKLKNRFSLYDDSIMSEEMVPMPQRTLPKTSMSLPQDINCCDNL